MSTHIGFSWRSKKHISIATGKARLSPKNADIFLISPRKRMFGYSLEAPQQGTSNEYPYLMFL